MQDVNRMKKGKPTIYLHYELLTVITNSGGTRIFLRGDANYKSGCASLLFCRFFRKLHENERILSYVRGTPLHPPMSS